jgi:hypothetical protein
MERYISRRDFLRIGASIGAIALARFDVIGSETGALPDVLIIGDSISMGYMPFLKEILAERAYVWHPDENCEGTTKGVLNVDGWIGSVKWDVIHFNFGLHDLKHVNAETGVNSTKPEDPLQADLKQYSKNLKEITGKFKSTGAKLIFATTTPVPEKSSPLREPEQVVKYNRAALKIMKREKIEVNDLYGFALPVIKDIQLPDNVHFKPEGYRLLAEKVSECILKAL